MPISNPSEIVSIDADVVLAEIEAATGGLPRSVVEYDAEEFNPLYVDDATLDLYGDEEAMLEHFDRIHSYVHVDFAEMDLFTGELFPIAEDVRYIATGMDVFTLVRIYVGSDGIFVAVDPGTAVTKVVEAVTGSIDT